VVLVRNEYRQVVHEEWVNCAGEREDLRGCLDGVPELLGQAWGGGEVQTVLATLTGLRDDLHKTADGVDDEFRSAWAHQPVEVESGDWRGVFGKVLLW